MSRAKELAEVLRRNYGMSEEMVSAISPTLDKFFQITPASNHASLEDLLNDLVYDIINNALED